MLIFKKNQMVSISPIVTKTTNDVFQSRPTNGNEFFRAASRLYFLVLQIREHGIREVE